MKGKYKNRTRVEKGFGPRHALNAQEGEDEVPGAQPSELPTPPVQAATPNDYSPSLKKIYPNLLKAFGQAGSELAGMSKEDYAKLAISMLAGGEEMPLGEPGAVPAHVWNSWEVAKPGMWKVEPDMPDPSGLGEGAIRRDEAGNHYQLIGSHTEGVGSDRVRHMIVRPVEAPGSSPPDLSEGGLDLSKLTPEQQQAWTDASPTHYWSEAEGKMIPYEKPPEEPTQDLSKLSGQNWLDAYMKQADEMGLVKPSPQQIQDALDALKQPSAEEPPLPPEEPPFTPNVPRYARGKMSVGPRHADNAFQGGTSDTSGYNPSGFYGYVLQPQDVEKMRQQMDAPGRSSLSPIEETLAANPDAQSFYYDQTSGGYVPFGGASGYAGGDENIKPGSINDEVPLPVQGNTEMVETPTDTSHSHGLEQLDIPPASETPEVNLDTLGLSPGQMEIINALGYDPSQNQGAGGGGMQLINELGYDPSAAYGSSGSGVPTQTGAGYGGQFVGGLLGNLLLPGIGGLVGSQLGGAGARMLTRSLQGGQVPWQTSAPQTAGAAPSGGGGLGDLFPQGTGGLGEPMGYFPWYSPGETGSSSYAPFTGGVGGEGGTLGNSDMSNVGAGPLPGSFAGLGSFGGGDLGSYGGGIGEHTPSFQAWVQGQGFPNVTAYQAAMAPQGPSLGMAAGGGGAPVGLQHATGGHIQTAQAGKSNVHSTDTVPAMLTPREAVLNRNAAELAGRGNIQKLNSEGNQLAEQGVDLAGEDKNMKQKYQRGAARIAPVPLTGPKPTARADLAGIMKYLPMGQLARSAQSQAVMPKVGVRGYQAGTSATDPLSMYQSKLSTSPLGGGQSLGGGPGPSPFPGPSPTPNPGPGPMPVSTTPPPYGGRPVPTLGGAPAVPPRPDAGKDPTGAMSTPLSFNNWAANAGAPGFVTQPVPPQGPSMPPKGSQPSTPPNITIPPLPQSSGAAPPITTRTPPPLPSASFFPPPAPGARPLGFQGGTIDAPQAGTQFANVQYSAPQINIAALKQHLQSQGIQPNQISGIINQIAQYRGSTPAASYGEGSQVSQDLGPALEAGFPGYQGGISDIGYPPMVGPNMVYHADKGSNWIGEFDPRYTFQRYWRGTGAVMPMGAGLGPVMGARPFVHPVRPVPPVRF